MATRIAQTIWTIKIDLIAHFARNPKANFDNSISLDAFVHSMSLDRANYDFESRMKLGLASRLSI